MNGEKIYLSLIFFLSWCPYIGFGERVPRLPKCWTHFAGECIHVHEECPFVHGNDLGQLKDVALNSKMCHTLNNRRCCIPPAKKPQEKRYDNQCGISAYQESDAFRIIGGVKSELGEWPWHVVVRYRRRQGCGGVLIHPRWVLSAAHCFVGIDVPLSAIDVVISEVNLAKESGVEQIMKVKTFITHSLYEDEGSGYDIALLELESDVELNDATNTVCLPNVDEEFDDMVCTVTGFGMINATHSSATLRQVNVPIVPNKICKIQMAPNYSILEDDICAGFMEGGRDSCQGDSGGPLVCRKKDFAGRQRWILAGLVSYGIGCAWEELSGVYTRVSKYLDWIEYHTKLPFYDGSYVNDPRKKYVPHKVRPS